MKFYIANMITGRCIKSVTAILVSNKIEFVSVKLGVIETLNRLSLTKLRDLKEELRKQDFELVDSNDAIIVQKIKSIVINFVRNSDEMPMYSFSCILSKELNLNYTYVANLFSRFEGRSITGFMIANKIERVKELLLYRKHSLTEIADTMHYSSVAHLSGQFKKVTGMTPTLFLSGQTGRLPLEDL